MSAPAPRRTVVGEGSMPRLAPHVRFSFDRPRDRWVVLAPERLLLPDEIAVEILQRCDGRAALAEVIDALAADFDAPRAEIAADVIALVQELVDQGVLAA